MDNTITTDNVGAANRQRRENKVPRGITGGQLNKRTSHVNLKKTRRTNTAPERLWGRHTQQTQHNIGAASVGRDPIAAGRTALANIVHDLDQFQLQTAWIMYSHYQWLLPNQHTTSAQLAVFDRLRNSAMTVSNDDLATVTRMETSTLQLPAAPIGDHIFCLSRER